MISRAEAKARGLKRFFTGEPCLRGHVAERRVSGGDCAACNIESQRKYREENLEKVRESDRESRRKYREENREKVREGDRTYHQTAGGRAAALIGGARRRAEKADRAFDLSVDDIARRIAAGVCEATGLPFDLSPPPGGLKNNPQAPSLDRRDSFKGYTQENTRVVCAQFNMMAGQLSDLELVRWCRQFLTFRGFRVTK